MFSSKKSTALWGIIISVVLVALDQITKQLALAKLYENDFIIIKNVLQLHYLQNDGAAFSMLKGQQLFFLILTPIALLIIAFIFMKLPKQKRFIPMHLLMIFIFSGAIGNFIDRALNGYVIDFIYFSLIDFPVFNVADMYITCSVILLALLIMFYYKDNELEGILSFKKKKSEDL